MLRIKIFQLIKINVFKSHPKILKPKQIRFELTLHDGSILKLVFHFSLTNE